MAKRITIIMDGGVIQDILDIPADCEIEVRDFDVEGCEFEDVLTDDNGEEYTSSVWGENVAPNHLVWACPECKSKNVNASVIIDANTREWIDDCGRYWCNACEELHGIGEIKSLDQIPVSQTLEAGQAVDAYFNGQDVPGMN
jgi:hypothetical protein